MIDKKTVRDLGFSGKRVLMRVDFNVPMKDGVIQDDTRIRAALPTIKHVLGQNVRSLVLMSHLGDPKKDTAKAKEKAEKAGKQFDEKAYVEGKHRMAPVAARLAELIGCEVKLSPDCLSEETQKMVSSLAPGGVLMLENTRFHKEETSKDEAEREKMAKVLAGYGEIYVNDAFGSAHRAHASTETVAKFVKSAVAGLLMEKEVEYLGNAVGSPKKPFVLVLGGAKVSSKIGVIEYLLPKVDKILIGGGMAYTFLKAKGLPVGNSLLEAELQTTAFEILKKASEKGVEILLPVDHIAVKEFKNDARQFKVGQDKLDGDLIGVDIGPKTIGLYKKALRGAKTVVWNGPMGVFEMPNFAKGTKEIAKALAGLYKKAVTIVGGGDSVSALQQTGLSHKIAHVSTGGGASLEFLEGQVLPGIAALNDR
jgi:phosphoglycerate kinase